MPRKLKSKRGGARPGSGRKPTGEAREGRLAVRVDAAVLDAAKAREALGDGPPIADFVREKLREYAGL